MTDASAELQPDGGSDWEADSCDRPCPPTERRRKDLFYLRRETNLISPATGSVAGSKQALIRVPIKPHLGAFISFFVRSRFR